MHSKKDFVSLELAIAYNTQIITCFYSIRVVHYNSNLKSHLSPFHSFVKNIRMSDDKVDSDKPRAPETSHPDLSQNNDQSEISAIQQQPDSPENQDGSNEESKDGSNEEKKDGSNEENKDGSNDDQSLNQNENQDVPELNECKEMLHPNESKNDSENVSENQDPSKDAKEELQGENKEVNQEQPEEAQSSDDKETREDDLTRRLDQSVFFFSTHQNDVNAISETEQQELIAGVEIIEDPVEDETQFPSVLFSIEGAVKSLMESPKMEAQQSIEIDYMSEVEAVEEDDQLNLYVGIPISRSESLESLNVDPEVLFFSKTATEREFPRTESPEVPEDQLVELPAVSDQVSSKPTSAESAPEKDPEQEEEKIDREEYIQRIIENLEAKEKLSAKNIQLQNKLGEYFKKKRVWDTVI